MMNDVLHDRVAAMLPEIVADLERMAAVPSVALAGFPPEPVHAMAGLTVELLRRAGIADTGLLDVPGGYPAVYGRLPGPPDAPTVLLYAHYDVHPAGPAHGWDTDPWTPTRKPDGRIYGRGTADNKSGIAIHAATIRAFEGRPPVGVRIIVEGEEEAGSHLPDVVGRRPELFGCDVMVVADTGGPAVGEPALTGALRGDILASLHDRQGDVAVAGLSSGDWIGGDYDADSLRTSAGVLDGVDLIGSGTIASRLWAMPSVTAIGIDAPRLREASNVLVDEAAAKLSLRVPPGADPGRELDLLIEHCRRNAPWGVEVDLQPGRVTHPVEVDPASPATLAARQALEEAFGRPAGWIGSGGSIQLVAALRKVAPRAQVLLWGAEDFAGSSIHGPNESVDPAEVQRYALTEALLLEGLAATA
jgi:acetylornithine deacetylase/succinyl-diaminopimelate desuccinylase-like protein